MGYCKYKDKTRCRSSTSVVPHSALMEDPEKGTGNGYVFGSDLENGGTTGDGANGSAKITHKVTLPINAVDETSLKNRRKVLRCIRNKDCEKNPNCWRRSRASSVTLPGLTERNFVEKLTRRATLSSTMRPRLGSWNSARSCTRTVLTSKLEVRTT